MSRPDEIDIAKGVPCPGYNKLVVLEDCKKCHHFIKLSRDEIKQADRGGPEKVVEIIERVLCSYPAWRDVHTLCKVGKEEG